MNQIKEVVNMKLANAAVDTVTASAASVGVMTFLGISLSNWVMILTCVWFLVLIGKWFVVDIWPMLVKCEKCVFKYFKKD